MWSTPRQGTGTDSTMLIVRASRKSSRRMASATTMAYLPSGVKYMLYGSLTLIVSSLCPVAGSMRVTLSPRSFSTQRVLRSYEGMTCCGCVPTAVWHVHALGEPAHDGAQIARPIGRVHIVRIDERWHPR